MLRMRAANKLQDGLWVQAQARFQSLAISTNWTSAAERYATATKRKQERYATVSSPCKLVTSASLLVTSALLVVTGATLLGTSALLVVTRSAGCQLHVSCLDENVLTVNKSKNKKLVEKKKKTLIVTSLLLLLVRHLLLLAWHLFLIASCYY